ncbi:MAG: PEP-CTERM sorting domain-containing protein [Desulfatiglans sp.]|nr:PEP-CTERM sorting domain-containing protein [Desulfatiglans sp.]
MSKGYVICISALFVFMLVIAGDLSALTLTIDSKSNIYGAGHSEPPAPTGNTSGAGILPPVYYITENSPYILTFSSITGLKSYNSGANWWDAEGYQIWDDSRAFPSWDGISGMETNSFQFLAGVFLDDNEPRDPAPLSLDFGPTGLTRNFTEVSPEIAQLFFIGDGKTDSGLTQSFFIPENATRLYLGFIDTNTDVPTLLPGSYFDNVGSVTATFEISSTPVPEPSTILLLLTGIIGLTGYRLRKGGQVH